MCHNDVLQRRRRSRLARSPKKEGLLFTLCVLKVIVPTAMVVSCALEPFFAAAAVVVQWYGGVVSVFLLYV